jgi:hypothetical protein
MGQLFDGDGELLQGLANALSPCLQLTAVRCGQVLVPKAALKGLDILLIRRSFRDLVEGVRSPAL